MGLGYEASDSANTRPRFAITRSTPTSCLICPMATSLSWASIWAIASACSRRSPVWVPTEPACEADESPPSSLSTDGAERRPITVMFCDLVGSTSLAAKLDAEDWRNLVNAYLDEASAAVTGFGGHVLKKLGDGLMALFGYPQAQENDAERAVRAALAIQRALVEINARNAGKGAPELRRGSALSPGRSWSTQPAKCSATRRTSPRGSRLAAEPGSVLITAERSAPGGRALRRRGARARTNSRACPSRVQLFRIVRASGGGRRGGARALTPFVGREEELGLLTRRWERARKAKASSC